MSGEKRDRQFKASDLVRLHASEEFQDERETQFQIGDIVTINSGGPNMLVVDIDGIQITTAWRDDDCVTEGQWSRPCLHRIRSLW